MKILARTLFKMKEIEIKYSLKNHSDVITRLNKIAKPQKNNELEKDTYFKLNSKLLRVRESPSGTFISHKKRINKNTSESFYTKVRYVKPLKRILKELNFKPIGIVKKQRSTWVYKCAEISVDKLEKLGYFLEIESTKKIDFSKILKLISADVKKQSKGYLEMIIKQKENKTK